MTLLQVAEARAEYVVADALGVVDDALLRHRIDGSDDRRGGERVTGVGEATGEDPLVEGGCDRVGDDHAAHGDVAGVGALGEDDEVGLSRPVLPGEPLAGAPKAAHDLVGNPHDLVLVAQRPQTLEIAGRRHEDARGADDRLEQDRADRPGALELDDLLEVLQRALTLLLG